MSKYIEALQKVEWPKSDEVNHNFWIVLIGIISLTLYFFLTDSSISFILENLYN